MASSTSVRPTSETELVRVSPSRVTTVTAIPVPSRKLAMISSPICCMAVTPSDVLDVSGTLIRSPSSICTPILALRAIPCGNSSRKTALALPRVPAGITSTPSTCAPLFGLRTEVEATHPSLASPATGLHVNSHTPATVSARDIPKKLTPITAASSAFCRQPRAMPAVVTHTTTNTAHPTVHQQCETPKHSQARSSGQSRHPA